MSKRIDEIKQSCSDPRINQHKNKTLSDILYLLAKIERYEKLLKMLVDEMPLREAIPISSAIKEALKED